MKPPSETATVTASATPDIVNVVRTGRRRRFLIASSRYRRRTNGSVGLPLFINSSLKFDRAREQLIPIAIRHHPALHTRGMAFSPRRRHGDFLQVHAERLFPRLEVEVAAHGLALLLNRSRHGYRFAEKVCRLLDQSGNLGLGSSGERAEI